MKKYFNKIHYSKELDPLEDFVKVCLSLFSSGYEVIVNTRNMLYRRGTLYKVKLPAYTISIGNLTTGGTGKTPITIEVAKYIKQKFNKKVVVLSRGYGGKLPTDQVNIISDGNNILATPEMAGDEPYLMASKLKGIPVLTGRNRIESGKIAIQRFGAEVLLLDDGYQHIKLYRDLDILVVDYNKRFGNNMLLPAGPLREPLTEIRRAHKIILVNKNPFDDDKDPRFAGFLEKRFKKEVHWCNFKNGEIYDIQTSKLINPDTKAYAFTGIAQPEYFFNHLKGLHIELVETEEFTDHHLYTEHDLKDIIQKAKEADADSIITTEKDAVKLLPLISKINTEIPIFALKLELDIDLDNLIGTSLNKK
jgi:tetraacyldisaccharide 4'-kinase